MNNLFGYTSSYLDQPKSSIFILAVTCIYMCMIISLQDIN